MVAIAALTAWAMVGNLFDYYANFEELWLLSLSGTLILALDIWILLEGFRTLRQVEP
jgi:ABC-type nickel/cobalt efflux system permease component RcnA